MIHTAQSIVSIYLYHIGIVVRIRRISVRFRFPSLLLSFCAFHLSNEHMHCRSHIILVTMIYEQVRFDQRTILRFNKNKLVNIGKHKIFAEICVE